jgi:hypothetical protein
MPAQYRAAARLARRGVPIAIELYRRWRDLTPEQRERYLNMAREYADRAGETVKRAQQARVPRGRRR